MKEPQKVKAFLEAVRNAVSIPLTIKMRAGWDKSGVQAIKLSEIAQASGVDAIAIHPRTANQGFGGKADWSLIATIKQKVSIPVIGNGDIERPEDALKMLETTGCDAVMIGRAAIGNPWIFSQVLALVEGRKASIPDIAHRFDVMINYLRISIECFGEKRACRMMRSQLGWFVKGLHNNKRFRVSIKHLSAEGEALYLINEYRNFLHPLYTRERSFAGGIGP